MPEKRKFKINVIDLQNEDVIHEATIVASTPEELAKYVRRLSDNIKQLEFEPLKAHQRSA